MFSLAPDCLDADAFSTTYSGTPYVFLSTRKTGERGRFDAAHELGHLVLHSEHRIPGGRNRSLTTVIERLCRGVDGVVSVSVRLACRTDDGAPAN